MMEDCVRVEVGANFLEELESALLGDNLIEANRLIKNVPLSQRICLKNHVISELPVLHYLARKQFRPEPFVRYIPPRHRCKSSHGFQGLGGFEVRKELETLIGFYIQSGYEVDKRCSSYPATKNGTTVVNFTALLAAVEQKNWMMVELLIKFGADVNVRDGRGLSACHWAVIVGELKTLEVLLDNGAVVTATEAELKGENDIHPILHTAIDLGRYVLAFHLVTNKVVDVHQAAVYRNVRYEVYQDHAPSEYYRVDEVVKESKVEDVEFTPLARAVRKGCMSTLQLLLNSRSTGLNELHFCMSKGVPQVVDMIIHRFADWELCNDIIGDKWALHCLHPKAFLDQQIEFTTRLISKYLDTGWNINATSSEMAIFRETTLQNNSKTRMYWNNYTLLHLACNYTCSDIVKVLVAKPDINLDLQTGGYCSLNPLQVSILNKDWRSARILVHSGCDFEAEGRLGLDILNPSRTKKDENGDLSLQFTSVELLLGSGAYQALPILYNMLEKGVTWNGTNELLAAIEGGSPTMIAIVFRRVGVFDFLTVEEFSSLFVAGDHSIPTLIYLLWSITNRNDVVELTNKWGNELTPREEFKILALLLDAFVVMGYDCNNENGYTAEGHSTHLIFAILKAEFKFKHCSVLLERLLEVEHVQLNVRNEAGLTPVEYVISLWNEQCISGRHHCWITTNWMTYCCNTVKLLVQHGANVQDLRISKDVTRYHHGYKEMFQMLYFAGAKFDADLFTPDASCHVGHVRTAAFPEEIEELRQWIEDTTNNSSLKLKWKAMISARGLLHRVGALQALKTLPEELIAGVLCETINI